MFDSYQQLGRDVRMVFDLWRGRRPEPYRARTRESVNFAAAPGREDGEGSAGARERPAGGVLATRTLEIVELVRETADAVTLWLADPEGEAIDFVPGQFFTVLVTLDGQTLRRAYSLSSRSHERARASITIKRVAGGAVSNYLNDHAAVGQRLRVLGPSGAFTVEPREGAARALLMLAGGSGVTPIMSQLRSVLPVETGTRAALIFGNRGPADIIFADALAELARASDGRLELRHVLSEPPASWDGGVGMLDADTLVRELERLEARGFPLDDAEVFVCGPEGMMEAAREALRTLGIPTRRVHEERFSQPHLRQGPAAGERVERAVIVRRGGLPATRFVVAPGDTVLEGGLAVGVPLRYSCAMGGCGACKVKLAAGEVEMEEPNCLTPAERARGEVLACVCRPRSDLVIELGGPRRRGPAGAHRR